MSAPQPPGSPETPVPEPVPASEPAVDERLAGEDTPSTWQPMLYLTIALLLAAIGYSVAFVAENTQQIRIHFVFATASVHLIWEVLLLLAVGLVGGVLLSQLYRHRRRSQLAKKARKQADARSNLGGRDEAERKPS